MWIIDGGSTDGTLHYLKTLTLPFNYISEEDTGIYDAMNKGIDRAGGEWLYFMGADDVFYNTRVLETVAASIQPDVKIILGKIVSGKKVLDSTFSSLLWIKNSVPHQGAFYSKELFNNARYDTSFKVLADYKFNVGLYKEKTPCKKIDLIIAACGADGISKKYSWTLYKEDIRLKVEESTVLLWPLFFKLASLKYLLKKF